MSSSIKDCVDNFDTNKEEIVFKLNPFVLQIVIYIIAGCLVIIPLVIAILVSNLLFKFRII